MAKRIALLPTAEFTPWIEQSLFVIGKALHDYDRHLELENIEDAITAATAVLAMLEEFKHRVA